MNLTDRKTTRGKAASLLAAAMLLCPLPADAGEAQGGHEAEMARLTRKGAEIELARQRERMLLAEEKARALDRIARKAARRELAWQSEKLMVEREKARVMERLSEEKARQVAEE